MVVRGALLRRVARRMVRGMVLRRTLPVEFGSVRLLVTPESQLKYLRPGRAGFDEALLSWVAEYIRPDETVWDIGANCGVFTFAAAGRGAHVYAVEPDPLLANLLLRSRAIPTNFGLRVEVLAAAAAETDGIAQLSIASGGRASNSLSHIAEPRNDFGERRFDVWVPTIRLDALLDRFSAPSLIKLDVEGAEAVALAGAEKILRTIRPRWLFECGAEEADSIGALFHRHNYTLKDLDAASRPTISRPAFNTLALPL